MAEKYTDKYGNVVYAVTPRPHCCPHHCLCGSNPNPKDKCCCAPPEEKKKIKLRYM